jgi:hypothetical protein
MFPASRYCFRTPDIWLIARTTLFVTFVLFAYGLSLSISFVGCVVAYAEEPPLVTVHLRYHMPQAGAVELVWGVNGWLVAPKPIRPAGTTVDVMRFMHTPMRHDGDVFNVKLQVPMGTLVDYGFRITQDRRGDRVGIWDGDYSVRATRDHSIDTTSKYWLLRAKSVFEKTTIPLIYFICLILVWASWGWITRHVPLSLRIRHATLIVLVNISLMSFVLVIGETYLRWQGFEPYVRTYPGQYNNNPRSEGRWEIDPYLGWVGGVKNIDINRQGFRDRKDFERVEFSQNKTRVIMLGDSFTWGVGVSLGESVPGLLQSWSDETHLVFNLGVPGWGLDQMYLAYQRYKHELDPHLVILAFIDDDILRVLESYRKWEGLNKPALSLNDDHIRSRSVPSSIRLWFDRTLGRSVFFSTVMREVYLLFDAGPLVRHLVRDMAHDTARRNAKFVVLRIPTVEAHHTPLSLQYTANRLRQELASTTGLYVDLAEEMRRVPEWATKFYGQDVGRHLSVEGYQFVARYIQNHIFKELRNTASMQSIDKEPKDLASGSLCTQARLYRVRVMFTEPNCRSVVEKMATELHHIRRRAQQSDGRGFGSFLGRSH